MKVSIVHAYKSTSGRDDDDFLKGRTVHYRNLTCSVRARFASKKERIVPISSQ